MTMTPMPADALIDAITDPLILLAGTQIEAANSAARALLPADCVGREAADVLPRTIMLALEGDRAAPPLVIAEFAEAGRHWEVRVGTVEPGRTLLHLIDRTAIEAVEKMRVDFVANASHELRTPIAAISGFAETLADDTAGGDQATRHRFVEIISREAWRMQRLVEDLMSLSRIEADRFVAPGAAVDFRGIAASAAQAAAEQRQPRGGDLRILPCPGPVMVRGEGAQLAQLVHNIVSNSFKYGELGTPVTLAIERRGSMARLTVQDHGEGIPATHLPRITQRFYRVDARRSRAVGGTGLGLAIVKHIVERHAGVLTIDSEVGRGTCVTVDLPLASASHQSVTGLPDGAQGALAEQERAGASGD